METNNYKIDIENMNLNKKDANISKLLEIIKEQDEKIKALNKNQSTPVTPQLNTPSKFCEPKFSTNGAIRKEERNLKYYYVQRDHQEIKELLETGTFFLLHGARSSSKTTTIFDLMDYYKSSEKYCFFYIEISPTRFNNAKEFWDYFYSDVRLKYNIPKEINDHHIFKKSNRNFFNNKSIFLVMDEFSTIGVLGESEFAKILAEIRIWKQSGDYNIYSCVGVGPFDITKLTNSSGNYSPFNVIDNHEVSVFTLEKVKELFSTYQRIKRIEIEDSVIENIFKISNGHPGLVCLCGRTIDENISHKKITHDIWMNHANKNLYTGLLNYKTVSNLMDVLTKSEQKFKDLVYQFILNFPEPIDCFNFSIDDISKLLTHGYIKRVENELYSLSSQLLKHCILSKLGVLFSRKSPNDILPVKGGGLDVPSAIKSLVPLFIYNNFATKSNRAQGIGSIKGTKVPAESFYHVELITTLCNWGGSFIGVIPNVITSSGAIPDLVVKYQSKLFVLELCAHVANSEVKEHIDRCIKYKNITNADESWVINFTTGQEDENSNFKFEKSNNEVGVIHVYHNNDFKNFQFTVYHPQKSSN